MTKIVANMGLMYGRDYLDVAIRSVIDGVDELHVQYALRPWQAYDRSTIPCPETEAELRAIAEARAGSKLRWHRGVWRHLGHQNDAIYHTAPDADVIISLDADEVWPELLLEKVVSYAADNCHTAEWRNMRVPFVHFWRSLHQAVLHDPSWPIRVILPRRFDKDTPAEHTFPAGYGAVAHLGYAQRVEIVRYKLMMHMHAPEFRTDCNWFEDIFLDESRVNDLHPVGSQWWNREPVDPLDYMPAWMAEHPYYGLEVIR